MDKNDDDYTIKELISDLYVEKTRTLRKANRYEKALEAIQMKLVCIGGPLNDNKHHYSKEQLGIFFDIDNLIRDTL